MLDLFARVFDLGQAERGRGAFEEVAEGREFFEVFAFSGWFWLLVSLAHSLTQPGCMCMYVLGLFGLAWLPRFVLLARNDGKEKREIFRI